MGGGGGELTSDSKWGTENTFFSVPLSADLDFSGKEGQPNIEPSTRPGIEPGTSGLGGRDRTNCSNPSAMFIRQMF